MDNQDYHKTLAQLQALRDAGGKFRSSQQLEGILWVMPSDFTQTNSDEFAYLIESARTLSDKISGFRAIIHSNPVKWLRSTNPSRCAEVVTNALLILPENTRASEAHYLISGRFAYQMSYEMPDAYASFFTSVLATVDDKAQSALATIRLLPNHSTSVFAVFPAPDLRLPPYVLIRNGDGDLKARPMTEGLHYTLSKDTLEALHHMVEEEAQHYGTLNNYDMAAVLSQAAFNIKPQLMAPA